MATIDVTKIEGFDGMTADQKVAALMAFDVPDSKPDDSKYVSKSLFDKTASELAETKRQLKGKMSDDEKAQAAQAEKEAAEKAKYDELNGKYENLMKQFTIANYKSSYVSLGYDDKLAQETAEALCEGKMDVVFANGVKHKTALEQKIKADLMKSDPKPNGSGDKSDGKDDPAIAKAKELAKVMSGNSKDRKDAIDYYS